MRRLGFATVPVVLAALVGGAVADAGRPPAKVKVTECVISDSDEGTASFKGSMRAVKGTRRMSMRFKLLERLESDKFTVVDTPGLGQWHHSQKGVRKFAYTQRVEALRAGAAYRALVQYRWRDADGDKLRSMRRRSKSCHQAAPLPNLLLSRIDRTPGPVAETSIYRVHVRNTGDIEARGVEVSLAVDGSVIDRREIDAISPGKAKSVDFTGPRCRDVARAVADPDNTIRESAGDDNARRIRCKA